LAGEDRARVTGPATIASVTGPVVVAVGFVESVALTVRSAVPEMVGVPVMVQPDALSPAGKVPLTMVQE
jgi:hypothetical protein